MNLANGSARCSPQQRLEIPPIESLGQESLQRQADDKYYASDER